MADPIPNHFTTEFSKNWIERIQQTMCRLDVDHRDCDDVAWATSS